jgi:hypothetical protein
MTRQDPFESARRRFRPDHIKILFVAEAPPSRASRRFFYFVHVLRGDTLFLEMMKVLYPSEFAGAKDVRQRKEEFLRRFKNDGFYLIDACRIPLRKGASLSEKKQAVRGNLPFLRKTIKDLSRLVDSRTKAILISKPVYEVCSPQHLGVTVINREMIDFPGTGSQKKFRRKLRRLMEDINN